MILFPSSQKGLFSELLNDFGGRDAPAAGIRQKSN
jgi:hypothetical protein